MATDSPISSDLSPISSSGAGEDPWEPVEEPMLREETSRFMLLPIRHPEVWAMHKKAQAVSWTAEEIDMVEDRRQFTARLTPDEQHFVKQVLAFFATADGIVNENLAKNFYTEVQWPEARAFYSQQMLIETIHAETYGLLLQTLVPDQDEQMRLLGAIETVPSIRTKAQWALRWTVPENASFAERLVAFAVVEGVFFSASFCAIFWLKKRGLLPGLCSSNEFISRDEGLHCDFACLLYSMLQSKLSQERVHEIVQSAVEAELEFVRDSLPVAVIGMNADDMAQYVKFVADRLLVALNYDKLFRVANPFDWMEMQALQGKANFFEKRVSEYNLANVGVASELRTFKTDEDF